MNTDAAAQSEFVKLGLRGVPAFKIGDDVVVGLDTQKIEALIDFQIQRCPNCGIRIRVPKNKGKLKITCQSCKTEFVIQT